MAATIRGAPPIDGATTPAPSCPVEPAGWPAVRGPASPATTIFVGATSPWSIAGHTSCRHNAQRMQQSRTRFTCSLRLILAITTAHRRNCWYSLRTHVCLWSCNRIASHSHRYRGISRTRFSSRCDILTSLTIYRDKRNSCSRLRSREGYFPRSVRRLAHLTLRRNRRRHHLPYNRNCTFHGNPRDGFMRNRNYIHGLPDGLLYCLLGGRALLSLYRLLQGDTLSHLLCSFCPSLNHRAVATQHRRRQRLVSTRRCCRAVQDIPHSHREQV